MSTSDCRCIYFVLKDPLIDSLLVIITIVKKNALEDL